MRAIIGVSGARKENVVILKELETQHESMIQPWLLQGMYFAETIVCSLQKSEIDISCIFHMPSGRSELWKGMPRVFA